MDNLIENPLDTQRDERDVPKRQTAHDPGPNLIANPLDKPDASDNLIHNPLDKDDSHGSERDTDRDDGGHDPGPNLIANPLDKR